MGCQNDAYCGEGCLAKAYTSIKKILCDIEVLPPSIPTYIHVDSEGQSDDYNCPCCTFCPNGGSESIRITMNTLVKNFYTLNAGFKGSVGPYNSQDDAYSSAYYTLFQFFNSKAFEVNCCLTPATVGCLVQTTEQALVPSSNGAGGYVVTSGLFSGQTGEQDAFNDALKKMNSVIEKLNCIPKLRATIIGFDGTVIFDSLYFKRCFTTTQVSGQYQTTMSLIPAPCNVKDFRGIVPAIDQVGPSSCIVDGINPIDCPPCEQNQSYPRFNLNTRKEIQFAMNNETKNGYAYRYSPLAYWLKRIWFTKNLPLVVGGDDKQWSDTDGNSSFFYAFGATTFGSRCNPFAYTLRLGYQVPYAEGSSSLATLSAGGCGCKH